MPAFKNKLIDAQGIGMKTAMKIEAVYPNLEELMVALVADAFEVPGVTDEQADALYEHFAPPPPPPISASMQIRACGQATTISYKVDGQRKSLFVRTSFMDIPANNLDVLDSAHFNDLVLQGRVEVKA